MNPALQFKRVSLSLWALTRDDCLRTAAVLGATFMGSLAAQPLLEVRLFAGTDVRPAWSSSTYIISEKPNASWIDDISPTGYEDHGPLGDLMDGKTAATMRQKFQDMNRDYELKSEYGLMNQATYEEQQGRMAGFRQDMMNTVAAHETSVHKDALTQATDRAPELKSAAAVGYGAAALYSGRPFRVRVTDDTLLQASTSIRQRSAAMGVTSSIVNAGVSVNLMNPQTYDPMTPPTLDPSLNGERYKVSISRDVPFLGISSQVAYGTTSNTVTASVSRCLTSHLTAVVDSIRSAPSGNVAGGPISEETLRFLYGVNF